MNEHIFERQASPDLLESLVHRSLKPVVVKDGDHQILRASDPYAAIFDTSPEDLSGRHTRSLWPDETAESIIEDERLVLDGETLSDRERELSLPDGESRWYAFDYVPDIDESGTVRNFIAIGRDIASRKRTERELDLFKNAIEASGHGVYITDPDGTIEYANPAFGAITGYTPEAVVGRNPRILKSGEMSDGYYEALWETVLDGEVWEEEVINRRRSGELYQAHQTIAPVTDAGGALMAFVAIQTDITERREREKRLQGYRQTVENSPTMLAAIDRDGTFMFANERFRQFYGLEGVQLDSETLQDAIGDGQYSTIETYLTRVFDGESVEFETNRHNEAGAPRRLAVRGYPIRDDEGVVGAAAAMRDITEEHERSQRIELLAEYRRVMSEVNRALFRTEDREVMLERVTDVIASSDEFGCTFAALVDDVTPTFVCDSGSDLDEGAVESFHSEAYIERVADDGLLWMDDVTDSPFAQHDASVQSHPGVGLTLGYGDEIYGVLTVHFPAGFEPERELQELLTEVADDIGLYIHGRELERERERTQRRLREEKRRYESLFDSIRDAIMVADTDRRIVNCNDAFEDLFGYDCEEIHGNRTKYVYESEEEYEAMGEAIEGHIGDPQFNHTVTYEKRSGQTFPGETNVFYLRGYDDEIRGFIGMIRDVSDREDRLQQLQVIDRVLRHNVNNDMNIVKGYAETIRDTAPDEFADQAARIVQTSEKLLETTAKERKITQFLSERSSGPQEELDDLVREVVTDTRNSFPEADIVTRYPEECSAVVPGTIASAVEELLDNAIVHSDRETPSIDVEIDCYDDLLRIRIADDGPGIPAMERNILSGQAEIGPLYHGSGLGLWLVNLVVRDANGMLKFEQNDPRGSVVVIRLPR